MNFGNIIIIIIIIIMTTGLTWCKCEHCKTTERCQKQTLMSRRIVPEVNRNRRNGGQSGSSAAAGMMTKTAL